MTSFPQSRLDQAAPTDDELRALATGQPFGAEAWRELTSLPVKWSTYEREAVFRESLRDAASVLGDDLAPVLQAHCEITVKPDGLAARVVDRLLAYLERQGFRLVTYRVHALSPLQVRDIWRYQWNVATHDRLRLFDLVLAQAPVLTLYLYDAAEADIPATVRLRGLKGSALPGLRSADSLRSTCQAPNRLLTLVHAADEPVDLVRELGIAHDAPERRALYAELADHSPAVRVHTELRAAVAELYGHCPGCDFDRVRAEANLLAALDRLDARAARDFAAIGEDGTSFYDWTSRYGGEMRGVDVWDVITAASFRVAHDRPGQTCTIDDDGRPEWFAGHGTRRPWRRA
jgi:nucleoside diphosphate kinase